MAVYLFIDTSTRSGMVGLWRDGSMAGARYWHSPHNHTAELMPAVDETMSKAGATPGDLDGVGVALGPGGFSALRAGLGVAKGLVLALNIPLAGVSTLEAAAYPHRGEGATLCSIVEAGRTLVAWAVFDTSSDPSLDPSKGDAGDAPSGGWRRAHEDQVSSIDEAIAACGPDTVFVGEGAVAYAATIKAAQPTAQIVDGGPEGRLDGLALLAGARLDAGDVDPVASLQPRYARPPEIGKPRLPRAVPHGSEAHFRRA